MNPPSPPAYSMSPSSDVYAAKYLGPPRWSALAITAFVLSFIGFLGFTAILGIILAVAGIAVTRGGRRRGMGLAISAIPISIVTGLIGAFFVIGIVSFLRMVDMTKQVEKILAASDDASKATDSLFIHATPSFQKDVSREQLASWLSEVSRKHGKLISLDRTFTTNTMTTQSKRAAFNLPGKFVNGQGLVRLHFEQRSLTQPLIDDIDVNGLSPRTASKETKSD